MNVHEISDVPINYDTKHEIQETKLKFSNLDINSNAELIHPMENEIINFDHKQNQLQKRYSCG